jgi:hypothetical protein
VGGGVSGSFDIVNSTLSGNSAAIAGGGVHRDVLQNMVIRHSTISGNTAPASFGSGIFSPGVNNGFKVRLQSSIVAGNTNSDLDSDGVVTFESLGFNLVGTGSGISAFSAANGDKIGLNPMLGPLANNGGPTFTRAPLPGSPAIDGGNPLAVPGSGTVPVYDQRQAPHSRVQGARIDIGAFESTPVVPSLLGDYNRDGGVNAADYVFWRKTEGTTGLVAFEGADGSGNGTIDPPDRTVWSVNFGRTESGGADIAGQASDDGTNMRQAVSSLHPRFGETRLHVVESLGNSNAAIGPFLNHAASSRSIANMVWLDYMPRALSPYIGTTEVLDSSSLDDAEPENGLDALDAVFGLLAAG